MFVRVSDTVPSTIPPVYRVYQMLGSFVDACDSAIPHPFLFINGKYEVTRNIIISLKKTLVQLKSSIDDYELRPKEFVLVGDIEKEISLIGRKIDSAQLVIDKLKSSENSQITGTVTKIQNTLTEIRLIDGKELEIANQISIIKSQKKLLLDKLKANLLLLNSIRNEAINALNQSWIKTRALKEGVDHIDARILSLANNIHEAEAIENKKLSDLTNELDQLANLKMELQLTEKTLIEQLSRIPDEVKQAKYQLESLEQVAMNRMNKIESLPHSAISNKLMYDLLRAYVEFVDLKKAIHEIKPPAEILSKLELNLTRKKERELDDLLSSIWCPASQDRNCVDFYFTIDGAKKAAILTTRVPTEDQLAKIIPHSHGNFWHVSVYGAH